ncbi:hypothetical protein FHW04_001169 [Pantoea sp. AN62]|jgi:hypothetical protein|uniref:Tail fiber protein n=3 Tax=root TaxID=1 RepID=A0A8S5PU94_9CAUD|nr:MULTISPECIES: hypothetical protein [Pantoea]DAE10053.1 MAG TPA: tail fiber protein [Siphoviridae sp. ct4sp3]
MHRIDTSTAQKDKFGAGKNGFTGGNPQTGELATALDADYFDDLQEEICNVIEGAGVNLAKGTRNQLLSALKQLPRISNQTFYTDTGSANAIIIAPSPAITALSDGQVFEIACAAVNTGAVTLKINALPAYPVIGPAGSLQGGEIGAAKGVIRVVWSASKSSFLLMSQNTAGPQQVAPATQSNQAVNLGQFTLLSGDAGYMKFPNGVILQWGSASIAGGGGANGALNVNYPVAFPNNFFQAVAVPRDLSGGTTAGNTIYLNFQTGTAPLSQLKVGVAGSNIGNLSFRYFAIGN